MKKIKYKYYSLVLTKKSFKKYKIKQHTSFIIYNILDILKCALLEYKCF